VEEIVPPAAHLEAYQAVVQMADIAATRIPDEAAVPVLANDLPMPQSLGLLEQSAAALAMPHWNALIEDAGEVFVLLAANLSKNTSTKDVGEVLLHSIAGLQVAAHPDGVIDNSMECLTEQLAALCLECLEGSVNVSASNTNEEMDVKVQDKH
jgi:hypothetical protein